MYNVGKDVFGELVDIQLSLYNSSYNLFPAWRDVCRVYYQNRSSLGRLFRRSSFFLLICVQYN
jgi:hypothetical protein